MAKYRLLHILKGLEVNRGITSEMLKKLPPPIIGYEHNIFVLIECHFGYSIKRDIILLNDMYILGNTEEMEEQREWIHTQIEEMIESFENSQCYLEYFYGIDFADILIKNSMRCFRCKKKKKGNVILIEELKNQMIEFIRVNGNF